jgi:transposase
MLTLFRDQKLIKAKGRQRTDSTHILAAIQVLNRLECIGETLRHALNVLATANPAWLQSMAPTVWFDRYTHRFAEYRLPAEKPARYTLAEQIGTDGMQLLQYVYAAAAPSSLRDLPAVQLLRQVWMQQFYAVTDAQPLRWRTAEDLPPAARLISSPYDPDARYSKKRSTAWTGYKVHLTETCDDATPHLITDVLTTPATTADFDVLPTIQQQLAARDLTPGEQIVDSGYPTADHVLTSQETYGIDLIGPLAANHSWQAKANAGFAAAQFVIDWEQQCAICPQGHTSVEWLPRPDAHEQISIQIKFAKADCAACPVRAQCTQSKLQPRFLQVRDQAHYEVLQAARQRQQTAIFKAQYAARAGIEGTISQGTRTSDLRRSRYIGLPKTRLLHVLIAAALNFIRVAAWLADTPRARTRQSAFARLAPASG